MQRLLDRLERRLGRWGVPHLTLLLVMGQVCGVGLGMADPQVLEPWYLVPSKVAQGEIWRLFSFLFVPPDFNLLVLCGIYFFWLMGTALEATWGTFKYNVYLLLGWLTTTGLAWCAPDLPTTGILIDSSVFLAFAWLFPDFQILLAFVLPVKIKWLARITWAMLIWALLTGPPAMQLSVLASVGSFLVFFGDEIFLKMRAGRRTMEAAVGRIKSAAQPFHRCAVCGRTEKSDPHMDFRFCSRCEGRHEYCEEHLRDHEHRTDPESVGR